MATCSYTTLGRYDKRARTIDEIRDSQRQKVEKSRHQAKTKKLIFNRASLIGFLIPDQLNDYYDDQEEELQEEQYSYDLGYDNTNTDENQNFIWNQEADKSLTSLYGDSQISIDSKMNDWNNLLADQCDGPSTQNDDASTSWGRPNSWADANSWCEESTWSCSPRLGTPTSEFAASSNCSRSTTPSPFNYNTHRINLDELEIPDYILEADEKPKKNRDKTSKNRSNICSKKTTSKQKSPKPHRSQEEDNKTIYEFETLTGVISNCLDSTKIDELMEQHWKILLDILRIDDGQVAKTALSTLTNLVEMRILSSDIILNLLQHGLILECRLCIWKYDAAFSDVLSFLLTIARTYKEAMPYMIELIATSPLMFDLQGKLELGETRSVQQTLEFYYRMSELLMPQLDTQAIGTQPLIPKILLQTGLTDKISQSYGPLATLTKLLDPKMIELLIANCLTSAYSTQENIMTMTFVILANALKVSYAISVQPRHCHKAELNKWSLSILAEIRSDRLVASVKSLRNSWNRALRSAESSEHCSQGIGIDEPAERLLTLSGQFVEFYETFFDSKSSQQC